MLVMTCKYKWMVSVVFGLLLSAAIEIIQFISHRGLFEFDDIVHNTLGVVIGIALYKIVSSIFKRLNVKRAT